MSQEKVDKKKYEKKHRKEIEKKNKLKKNISIAAIIIVLLAIVATPFGYTIYNNNKKDKENQAMQQELSDWLATYTATEDESSEGDSDTEEATDTESASEESDTTEAE